MSIEQFIQDHTTLTPEQMAAKYPLSYAHPLSFAGRRILDEQPVAKHIVPTAVLEEAERHSARAEKLEERFADDVLGRRRERTPVIAEAETPTKDMGDQVADLLLAQKYGCDSLEEAIARGFHKETP